MPTGHADGQGGSRAIHSNRTVLNRMRVGVTKVRVAFSPCGVEEPALSVMATNSKPINVAPAVAPTMKKSSQPWNIVLECSGKSDISRFNRVIGGGLLATEPSPLAHSKRKVPNGATTTASMLLSTQTEHAPKSGSAVIVYNGDQHAIGAPAHASTPGPPIKASLYGSPLRVISEANVITHRPGHLNKRAAIGRLLPPTWPID